MSEEINLAPGGAPQLNADSYDVTEQIGHLLRKAYQRHTAIFQQNACDPQLTSIQFVTLCALRDHGPSSQAELVKATAVDQATIRGIVERLKARNLVALSPDQEDRRKVIVDLTAAGNEVLDAMTPCARQISELTMDSLNAAERVAILFLLRKMNESEATAS
ncbi:MarR family winged helix-turn-helix transcriptional regulator (plasmid) [Pseudomonas sp. BYT-5]|uniref:MarR family winged helix-turn-helix transcriptional regulator n=1 Tax=unclassified Pseudomonas TaxID=196821 RepID=UPI0020222A6A|nr:MULTISPECIES: MarR family winged helix-turn-helix transcriptional regulator [unclassified Pseudomonas]URD45486.1 MarR family winged helix-turn-helix transcriptional regulator [Pseudomonas sp. BYT-5]URL00687.1 winged helix-turn-helix transcriptional regulator [Pseudomonas sp. BYT-1]